MFSSRGDCGVRIQMLVLMLELFGAFSQEKDSDIDLTHFLHDFLSMLTSEVFTVLGIFVPIVNTSDHLANYN